MAATLQSSLDNLIAMQEEESFILSGFYLRPGDIEEVTPYLSTDDPDVGAIGRYDRVPVFPLEAVKQRPTPDVSRVGELHGICYSYIKMGVIN